MYYLDDFVILHLLYLIYKFPECGDYRSTSLMFYLNTILSGRARFKIYPFYTMPSISDTFLAKNCLVCLYCDKWSRISEILL